jgi:hypothetical protein
LRHQLPDLGPGKRNKRAALVLVELRAEIQRMYSRIIPFDDDKMLGFAEQLPSLDELAFLRRERNPEPVALLADDRGRLQQNQPIARVGVIGVDRNEVSLPIEDAHTAKSAEPQVRQQHMTAGLVPYIGNIHKPVGGPLDRPIFKMTNA